MTHIHADGRLESHHSALGRLARMLNVPEEDMFHPREELLTDAYRRQEERIAYAVTLATASTTEKGAAG